MLVVTGLPRQTGVRAGWEMSSARTPAGKAAPWIAERVGADATAHFALTI